MCTLVPVCVPPSSPENGNISLSVDGLNITYSCNHGYTLIGDSSQSCLDDGSGWSGVFPNCSKCQFFTLSLVTCLSINKSTIHY